MPSSTNRPAVKDADVVPAFELNRIAKALAAHLAANVADRGYVACVQPRGQIFQQRAHVVDPMAQQS